MSHIHALTYWLMLSILTKGALIYRQEEPGHQTTDLTTAGEHIESSWATTPR